MMPVTCPLTSGSDIITPDKIYQAEIRLGLGMDNRKNRVREGILFSRPYRRFASDIQLDNSEWHSASITAYFQTCKALSEAHLNKSRLAFLGGDRSRAIISFKEETEEKPLTDLKEEVKKNIPGSKGFFCYLLTPAVKAAGWPQIDGKSPLSAATGKPMTISGWNTVRSNSHPRPALPLIPAGSVLFYEWNSRMKRRVKSWSIVSGWSPSHRITNIVIPVSVRVLIGVWK